MGKKNVAFRCLEIRLGLRKEQPFCVHHNRLTGEASGRKENQTRLQKNVLTGTPADLRCRQWKRRTEGREGRRSSIGGGDGRPREHFLSRGVQCRLRPQLKGSFLLPPPPPPPPPPQPPPSRLHAFAELSEQIPTIPAVEKPSLAPPEVASKKKKNR